MSWPVNAGHPGDTRTVTDPFNGFDADTRSQLGSPHSRAMTTRLDNESEISAAGITSHARADFRGRPPFAPLALDAAAFAGDFVRPASRAI
jgi:hypothetical protein